MFWSSCWVVLWRPHKDSANKLCTCYPGRMWQKNDLISFLPSHTGALSETLHLTAPVWHCCWITQPGVVWCEYSHFTWDGNTEHIPQVSGKLQGLCWTGSMCQKPNFPPLSFLFAWDPLCKNEGAHVLYVRKVDDEPRTFLPWAAHCSQELLCGTGEMSAWEMIWKGLIMNRKLGCWKASSVPQGREPAPCFNCGILGAGGYFHAGNQLGGSPKAGLCVAQALMEMFGIFL